MILTKASLHNCRGVSESQSHTCMYVCRKVKNSPRLGLDTIAVWVDHTRQMTTTCLSDTQTQTRSQRHKTHSQLGLGALGALGVRVVASCTPAALLRSAAKAGGRRDRVKRDTVVPLALCLCSPRSPSAKPVPRRRVWGMGSSLHSLMSIVAGACGRPN